jgi:gamma-glutamyltranspeptidase/glutathione hydrolase
MRYPLLFVLLFLGLSACKTGEYNIQKKLEGNKAMVVSAHPLASEAGRDILRKGGNAIDAMVTVHFMLTVVYQRAGNIGGGGFMVYRDNAGKAHTLDFREKAPQAAHRDMYLDPEGNPIDSLSRNGCLAVGVPGSVAGIYEAHQKFGSKPWAELLAPAIKVAEKGFALTEIEADLLNRMKTDFKKINRYEPIYIRNDREWKKGDIIVNKDLAMVLRDIQEKGRDGFYKGRVADLLVDEMKAGGGIISKEDLANYEAAWRDPIEITYKKDYKIISMPPPSSGGIILAELLQMIEDEPLEQMGFHSINATHLMVEAERRAYADRAEHLGDADFYPVPIEAMLEKKFARQRMQSFSRQHATPSKQVKAGIPRKVSEQTTHYSIVDANGNAIAVTTTLNGNFGSRVVVKGGGFVLNNEMDDFSAKPGSPNMFGLLGNEANAIQPGKRMLSSMTPTIVEKNGKLFLVVGTPGGSTIITSVFQVITNVIDFKMSIYDAVQKPRFHHQWMPDHIYFEKGAFDETTMKRLKEMGHQFKERKPMGQVDAIMVMPDGSLEAAADKRGDDSAAGY